MEQIILSTISLKKNIYNFFVARLLVLIHFVFIVQRAIK